jgi:hypothetical protein
MPEKNRTKWGKIHRPITSRGRTHKHFGDKAMTYTQSLQLTTRAAWAEWYNASSIACRLTATAWGWYAEAFFSEAAQRRYEWAGQMIACLGLLAFLYGRLTRRAIQRWVDAEVADKQPKDHVPAAGQMVAARPATVATPVAVTHVEVAGPVAVSLPPIRVLKQMAKGKVKGYYNMKQAELWEALGRPAWSAID